MVSRLSAKQGRIRKTLDKPVETECETEVPGDRSKGEASVETEAERTN